MYGSHLACIRMRHGVAPGEGSPSQLPLVRRPDEQFLVGVRFSSCLSGTRHILVHPTLVRWHVVKTGTDDANVRLFFGARSTTCWLLAGFGDKLKTI